MYSFWWIIQYLKFRINSFYLHGIHSPFIFQLGKVIRDNKNREEYECIHRFRESLFSSTKNLTITDHGAGSRVFSGNERSIKDLLKFNSTSTKRAQLLYRLANHYRYKDILELGTSLGIGSHAMAMSSVDTQVTTVEGSTEVAEFAKSNFANHDTQNVRVISDTFSNYLDQLDTTKVFDLIFLDGHHDGNATEAYFERLLMHTHDQTLFILDDIRWSKDMYRSWKRLCAHHRVTASVDTFRWGFLFLRKEQRQEKFYIPLR